MACCVWQTRNHNHAIACRAVYIFFHLYKKIVFSFAVYVIPRDGRVWSQCESSTTHKYRPSIQYTVYIWVELLCKIEQSNSNHFAQSPLLPSRNETLSCLFLSHAHSFSFEFGGHTRVILLEERH